MGKLIIAESEVSINRDGLYCLNDLHKAAVADVAKLYHNLGFEVLATSGTAGLLAGSGVPCASLTRRSTVGKSQLTSFSTTKRPECAQ